MTKADSKNQLGDTAMIQAKNDSVLDKGRNGGDEKWSNSGHDLKEHFGALPMD